MLDQDNINHSSHKYTSFKRKGNDCGRGVDIQQIPSSISILNFENGISVSGGVTHLVQDTVDSSIEAKVGWCVYTHNKD